MEGSAVLMIACFIALAVYWALKNRNSRTPPGPIGLPIVGYIPFMTSHPHLVMQKLSKTYGPVFSLKLGNQKVIILSDFESTKEAFNQDAYVGRPPQSSFVLNKETIETGAFNGLPYKEQRRFSAHMLRDLGLGTPRIENLIREEIYELLEHVDGVKGRPIIAKDILSPSMSNNIATIVFGKRWKFDDPRRILFDQILNEAAPEATQVSWMVFYPWLKTLLGFLQMGRVEKVKELYKVFKEVIAKEIKEHEATFDENNLRDYIDGYLAEIRKRNDPAFSKPVLVDMVYTLFGAGSLTVRITLEWLILTMATYPDVQKKVQAEIDEVINEDRLPIWSDHLKMPYTEACILETGRWRNIVPVNVLRYTLTDTELQGYFIPKHSYVISNLWQIHHDPKYWGNDAEEFRPERFLSEDGKEVQRSKCNIPFSIGKRTCPGETFAKVEVFLYFVSLLQRYNLSLPEGEVADFEGELGILLMPKHYEVCMKKRV